MKSLSAGTIARVYLAVVLVLAILFSSFFQLAVSVVLLGLLFYSSYKPVKPNLNLALTVGLLAFAPLALEALAGAYTGLLLIPGLVLLDGELRKLALTKVYSFRKVGRSASDVLKALSVGFVLVLGVAVLVWNFALLLSAVFLLAYLAGITLYSLRSIPKEALVVDRSWRRVVVGNSESAMVSLGVEAKKGGQFSLHPVDKWVKVKPTTGLLKAKEKVDLELKFTAPLAGPSKIGLHSCFVDSRGLVETGQNVEPLDLHIIPKAKYAAWLASKFLEQTSSGGSMAMPVPTSNSRYINSGVEFYGSRAYQLGDPMKAIDWIHSYRLGELIVKEYSGSQGQVGIILADLSARNAEDADELAYHLVMSALTYATEGVPSGLAAFNSEEVVSVVHPGNSRETLKKALTLTEKITISGIKRKVLEAPLGDRLKRSVNQLSQTNAESAQRLEELLGFESEANEETVKTHPAALALAKIVEKVKGSAVLTVVSTTDDMDDLSLVLEQMKKKGYSTIYARKR